MRREGDTSGQNRQHLKVRCGPLSGERAREGRGQLARKGPVRPRQLLSAAPRHFNLKGVYLKHEPQSQKPTQFPALESLPVPTPRGWRESVLPAHAGPEGGLLCSETRALVSVKPFTA